MAINLMYITNNPKVAVVAEKSGVDRIFVDMEYIGKDLRQGGMDTVQSHHTFEDIKLIKENVTCAKVLVRCNPIHNATHEYESSENEINKIIDCGADIIMLPYFKTTEEVATFIKLVNKRARTMLLFETPESRELADEILELDGIDEVFIGLNDMSLGYGMKFMFQLLSDGTVDELCDKFRRKNIPYGFGGLASLEGGLLPGKMVLTEHYRLGSSCVILSRSFCNTNKINDFEKIEQAFQKGLADIRAFEEKSSKFTLKEFEDNKQNVKLAVDTILERIQEK